MYYLGGRYYDPKTRRFISPDDVGSLSAEHQHAHQDNLYAYCFNNPINLKDEDGLWPSWATKVIVGAVAIAASVAVVALTGGGAAAAVPALLSSLKVATTSAATGAAIGAIGHRVSTGKWKGWKKAAVEGAADGFMWGGITAGVTNVSLALDHMHINKIGRNKAVNNHKKGYLGLRYGKLRDSGNISYKTFELHSPHIGRSHPFWHWQLSPGYFKDGKWHFTRKGAKHWTLWGKRV